jgi:ABC-2 type transport system permease protein
MQKIMTLIRMNLVILLRQRALLVSSLGLAVISMLVFGSLFGGNNSTKTVLGIVDQDHSQPSQQVVSQLQKSDALMVYTGNYDDEKQALQDGQRDAIIIIGPQFGSQLTQGNAHLQVFYNQSNPITTQTAQLAVQAIVDGINRNMMHQPGPVTLEQTGVAVKDLRTIDIITPGMLGMLLMWANLAIGTQFVLWREMGITKRLAATPLKPITMIGSQVVARLALSIVQGIVLLGLAIWIFNVHIYGNYGLLLLIVILGALTMLALGSAIASFVKKSEATQSVVLLISFPMMFLGGSYFSVNGAPSFLQPIIHALPLYYLNDALRQIINNGSGWASIQTSVLVLIAWIVAALIVVWRSFRWV